MTKSTKVLLDQALQLSADERAILAANLWASVEEEVDPSVQAAWVAEIKSRLDRIESGEEKAIPWEEVRARLRAKFAS